MGYPVSRAYPFSPTTASQTSRTCRTSPPDVYVPTLPDDIKARIATHLDIARSELASDHIQNLSNFSDDHLRRLMTARTRLEELKSNLLSSPEWWATTYGSTIRQISQKREYQPTESQGGEAGNNSDSSGGWPSRRQWLAIRGNIADTITISDPDIAHTNQTILSRLFRTARPYGYSFNSSASTEQYIPKTGADLLADCWTFQRVEGSVA
ncbi:uncharacterized protein I303_108025 [Kwoniella dejecticola CBS 10117]|uniref:Uncharacterized protein n=1 Tax=Kwoniella dejecticola CBS 10117 TaxID=1296121 RepID=A0A1A5ZWC0_9TREE|nr:uncharacterized protein I303_08016 [Kwoniella dejecticola CBS 10117]OBR82102.1 hypothetical protein I303_08016 [Kwoniella dejecticola CBS 10117]